MENAFKPLKIPLTGTHLIEASAGTGKTYTIASLYLRLVLFHGTHSERFLRPLIPPEILVVTYTNAATEELRERIRKRLIEGARFFRENENGDDPLLEEIRSDFAVEEWPVCALMLEAASQWMDEAAIYTIHGWCHRMLRQHAFESASMFDLDLITDDRQLLETAACDYWRTHYYGLPAETLGDLLSLIGCATPQQLLERVRVLIKNPPELLAHPFELLQERQEAIATARQVWARHFDAATALVREAQGNKTLNNNKYRTASLEKWINQLEIWVKTGRPLPEPQTLYKFSQTGLAEGTAKNKSLPTHTAFEALDRLNEILAATALEAPLLVHAAQEIRRRFERAKEKNAQINFDDLLRRLHDALMRPGNDRFGEVIRTQFPIALIDEFQDTDPLQYAILKKIYRHQEHTGLFMIGDPKQAIYAFRGADIHTYLLARKDVGAPPYSLPRNYRSTSNMVAAVNRIFEFADQSPGGAFLYKEEIPFTPVSAKGQEAILLIGNAPLPALTFLRLEQDAPVPKTGEHGYVRQMAEGFATEIVRLLNSAQACPSQNGFRFPNDSVKALAPSDMAILVRNHSEATAMRQALTARKIRSVYLSDKNSVFATEEALSLFRLLCACANPLDETLLKMALADPLLALPLAELDRLNQNEAAWENEVERFRGFQTILRRRGVLPMINTFLHAFAVPRHLLASPNGERRMTNLRHLSELLQQESFILDGETALIRWLSDRIQKADDTMDEQILRLESEDDLIRVISIHKAKGLEYPLVFLPFICNFRDVSRNPGPFTIPGEDGSSRVIVTPEPDDIAVAVKEQLAEDLRLLYVALTRSVHACWLGIGVLGKRTAKGETTQLHQSGIGHILTHGTAIETPALGAKLMALKGDCKHIAIATLPVPRDTPFGFVEEARPFLPASAFTGRIDRSWWIASYSGILDRAMVGHSGTVAPGTLARLPDTPETALEDFVRESETDLSGPSGWGVTTPSIHNFPKGAVPGTFLHNLLEWAAGEGFGRIRHDPEAIRTEIARSCRKRGWETWAGVLSDWLGHLLRAPLTLPQGAGVISLSALAEGAYQAELEFMLATHAVDAEYLDDCIVRAVLPQIARPRLAAIPIEGMLKGFIDLVFQHEGRYYVVDYKSNSLGIDAEAYTFDTMSSVILEHRYDLQYVIYTLALHRLLKNRLPDYQYQEHVGGVLYLFLRGITKEGGGVFADVPPFDLITGLDQLFSSRKKDRSDD